MKIKQICILGGSGFVGTYIASRLSASGYNVNLLTRNREKYKNLLVLTGLEIKTAEIKHQHIR